VVLRILSKVGIVGDRFLHALNETWSFDRNALVQLILKSRVTRGGHGELGHRSRALPTVVSKKAHITCREARFAHAALASSFVVWRFIPENEHRTRLRDLRLARAMRAVTPALSACLRPLHRRLSERRNAYCVTPQDPLNIARCDY
jgi:hypothetical protein